MLELRSVSICAIGAALAMSACHATPPEPLPADEIRRQLLSELQPVRLKNCRLRRFGGAGDGGYLMCANLLGSVRSAYSYGVGTDGWGCQVSREFAVPVHEYDCFDPTRPVCEGGNLIFNAECIGPKTATIESRPYDTLANQISRNGDAGKNLVVKIDVEGAEWDSLMAISNPVLNRIDQLVMELHGTDEQHFLAVVRKLKRIFHPVHIHFNNHACSSAVYPFPAYAYQVLFVNKRIGARDYRKPMHALPHPQDVPDSSQKPDCQVQGDLRPR
jgi:hypothetical protein